MINADDMQSWAYLLAPTFQFVNTAGKPLTEGWIEVYIAGTRNKYYCASDFNGTLHPFQIPLDSLGANIVLADPDQAYDVYVYNKFGSLIMSRYHVSPGMAGSGILNITITSEDGTVTVNNDGNGNFDLSIKDTVDRIETLEQAVSGLSANSSVGYAIAHADTVNLDGTFNLVNDAITGVDYSTNMDGFRLKPGHVYQFNFNAIFENGEYDRNCSGKLYLEGPNTIAQEWKFDLDDSYYHSQSINGSTVLVTPNDLNYYDVKLKLAWDVDYPNKPNVDLNKISIVDITTILSTTVSGTGGDYTGGDGIFVNDETNVISVDMDYINSHLDFDASTIIASAVNIATAYTDARVTSVSGDLVNLIASVTGNIPTGTVTQVQSDWTEQDTSAPSYIKHKPDLTVYATNASLTAVSSVLQSEIDAISGAIPTDYVTHDEVSAVSGNIINTISTVSGDIIETVNNVSGDIIHTVESVSGDLVEIIETATANIPEQVNADWDAVSGKAEILNKPDLSVFATHNEVSGVSAVLNERINNVSGDLIETITTVSGYIINTVETVSAVLEGDIVSAIQVATGAIPEQINSDWDAVSGKAEILNKPDLSIYATHDELVDAVTAVSSMIPNDYVTHSEVSAVSSNLVNYVNSVSGDITNYVDDSIVSAINVATGACEQVQSDWTEDDTTDPSYIKNKPNEIEIIAGQNIGIFSDATTITIAASATDLSDYATHSEVNTVSASIVNQIPDTSNLATRTEVNTVSGIIETEIQAVSSAIGEQVPNVSIQSPSGTLTITETVSGNNKIYSIDVATASGIEYGQFFATGVSGTAVMSKSKGNIDVTNDGKIKLKQGQSYHVTVRGRYNQVVLKDNYSTAAYIEYITNNFININVDESRSDNQYFELSYDLFKLNSDTNYLVFFNLDDAEVNDLYIEIHSLANVGGNGSSGGSSPEYDAGYGIQILNNVISVSGIAPQIQSDWNQTNTSSKDFIKNKPEEYGLIAGDNISITASGNNFIISSTASAASGVNYQAGYGIDITGDTISVDASIIPSTSAYATKQELATVSGMIPDISDLATVELVSAVSGKLPTTETGRFIIQNNVSGGPVEVVCPTDVGMPVTNTILDSNAVSGVVGSGTSNVFIVYKSPGYDNDYWNYSNGQIILTVPEDVTGIYSLIAYYSNNSNPLSSNSPYFISNYVVPDTQNYKLAAGTYTINTQANQASSGYGKYITFVLAGPNPDATAFAKVTIKGFERHPELGISVDLDRYYLGNTSTTTSNSGTQAVVYTDPTTKKQTVFMPTNMPTAWVERMVRYVKYGSNRFNPGYYPNSTQYIAYKQSSNTEYYQYAYCTDYDYTNKKMTFISYDDSGNAIEKWTVDFSTYISNVWTTTPISQDMSDYISYSASGVYLPNSKFEIDTNGQAYKVISAGSESNYNHYDDGGIRFSDVWTQLGTYKAILPSNTYRISISNSAGSDVTGTYDSATHTAIINVNSITNVGSYLYAYSSNNDIILLNNSNTSVKYVVPAVTDEYITETSLTEAISAVTGAVIYQAGDYIGITDDTISVTGITDLVAGDNITITASGSSAIISATGGTGDVTRAELISVSGTLETEIQTVSAAIPDVSNLATKSEVQVVEANVQIVSAAIPEVSSFVTGPTVSAIVDTALIDVPTGVSGLVGGTNVSITASGSNYVIDATVPDVSNYATKTEVATVSASIPTLADLNTQGITDIQVVNSLPGSPVATVLYLIPET